MGFPLCIPTSAECVYGHLALWNVLDYVLPKLTRIDFKSGARFSPHVIKQQNRHERNVICITSCVYSQTEREEKGKKNRKWQKVCSSMSPCSQSKKLFFILSF